MYRDKPSYSAVNFFMNDALRVSVFASPDAPGLTFDELLEVGGHFDIRRGELEVALGAGTRVAKGGRKLIAPPWSELILFPWPSPDPRDEAAFQFVHDRFTDAIRDHTGDRSWLLRDALIAEGVAKGLAEDGLKGAITAYLLTEQLEESKAGIRPTGGRWQWASPKVQNVNFGPRPRRSEPDWLQLVALVRDIVGRRTDGRPAFAEPIAAFGAELAKLEEQSLRLWWIQLAAELKTLQPGTHPTAKIVLAAALAEGALAAVVKPAQRSGLSMSGIEDDPTRWKLQDLVRAAKKGAEAPILQDDLAKRCLELNDLRQRIHAGRLLTADPRLVAPDLRPDEAERAAETLRALLRKLLDWLQANRDRIAQGGR